MRSGSIAFLSTSTTLPSLPTLRSSAVSRFASPVAHRLSLPRIFPFLRTDSKIDKISARHNLVNVTTSRTITCASASSMASFFSPEKSRVPPAIELLDPPISKFKIGLCQLSVTADKERNIAHARLAIEEAAEKGAKLVLLPEIWNSPYSNDSFPVYAEDIDAGVDSSPSTAMLSEVARSLKIIIVGGSIPERCGDKLYNTCCVFGTDGKLKAKHRKIHLFDINIPGKITFEESKTLTAGETPTVVDTDVGRIGIGICYDIRFQELAALYAARE